MTVIPFQPRVQRGVPTAGQFAAARHSEAAVTLEPSTGRHTDPVSERYVPESLRMAHFQDPQLVHTLSRCVQMSGEDQFIADYQAEVFCDALPNLPYQESIAYYTKAVEEHTSGTGDWEATVSEAAALDTARHPGGRLREGYLPPNVDHQPGYQQGILSTGSRYTGYRDATEICKDIRAELKAATAANYLPAGLKYSVISDKFSGGQAIAVSIQGISDDDRLDHHGNQAERTEAVELRERVGSIVNAFNRKDIDSQSDYFNASFYDRVTIETDQWRQFREDEAARRKARAAARAAR